MTKKVLSCLTLAAAAITASGTVLVAPGSQALAQHVVHNGHAAAAEETHPWMNKALSPEERADMVLKEMTLDEKIELLHGNGMPGWGTPEPQTTVNEASREAHPEPLLSVCAVIIRSARVSSCTPCVQGSQGAPAVWPRARPAEGSRLRPANRSWSRGRSRCGSRWGSW